jgi:hypothetical protein
MTSPQLHRELSATDERVERLHDWLRERRMGREAIDTQFALLETQLAVAEGALRRLACEGQGVAASALLTMQAV